MENNLNSDILDKITKTCTCKSISRATIKEAIKNGANTIDEVSKTSNSIWIKIDSAVISSSTCKRESESICTVLINHIDWINSIS